MNPAPMSPRSPYVVVGRYAIFDEIASGGMATVHLGKLLGEGGFSRVVAIKRLHPQFAKDGEFSAMFLDEARLAARIQHANVVQTLDVVTVDKELLLVMEYVHGVSFASLLHVSRKAKARVDPRIVAAVVVGALEGLHAAHEAKSEVGVPLGVVHRDVSPQNVLVGAEGVPRILDFGVAKAVGKMHATREGQLKGKLAYMSPEQIRSTDVTRQSDVFSTAIVLWEALMGQRLFDGGNPAELIMQVLSQDIAPPRTRFPDLPPALEAVVMRGLSRDPSTRYATAREMALDLEAAVGLAPSREISRWVQALSGETLNARSQLLERIERAAADARPGDEGVKSGPALAFPSAPDPSAEPGLASQSGTRSISQPSAPSSAPPAPQASPAYERPITSPRSITTPSATAPSTSPPRVRSPEGVIPPGSPAARPARLPDIDPLAGFDTNPYAGPTPSGGSFGGPSPSGGAYGNAAQSSRPPARVHHIPYQVGAEQEEEQVSLRERIEKPLKVVGAGVVVFVVESLTRPFLPPLPFRLMWIAAAIILAGVLWLVARLVLPMKSGQG